jgi:chromosome segregation and condensation protein ScpB
MMAELKKTIAASPTKSVWIISAFRSDEVARAIQLLEQKGFIAKKKDLNQGYATALFELPPKKKTAQ